MVEMGAHAVIVQHTHCPGCFEEYRGANIVYGQGDLIFDRRRNVKNWQQKGFLVRLTLGGKDTQSMTLIPYIQSDTRIGARKMSDSEEKIFLRELYDKSKKLSNPSFIEEEWLRLSKEKKHYYLFGFLPGLINNRILQKINKYFPFIERLYTNRHLLRLENMLCCESHREVIQTILSEKRNKMRKP
jgi:poly-gamma-glutamate synthesis protein (capsule biosynthesis protein)